MSRYTLLSRCRLPWPPSCCQYQLTPFMASNEKCLWHLSSTFSSSHSASSAYQKWPTWRVLFKLFAQLSSVKVLTRFKFESRSKLLQLRFLQSLALPGKTNIHTSFPEGNFGGNQLLDGSISLSPLYQSLTIDLHVKTATNLHQSFPWLHSTQA